MGYLEDYINRRQDILHKKSWAEDAPPESNSDYLFDKELRNIINPSNPPFDIKMLKNDMN